MAFIANLTINFLVSFGMVVGGSILGGIGAVLTTDKQPMLLMVGLADRLKIWAMVAAIGGSMDVLKLIGEGMWRRELTPVGKQLIYLIVAFIGCQVGAMLVTWFASGSQE